MQVILLLLLSLIFSGCTITNLAPPEPDDGYLQRVLEEHQGKKWLSLKDIKTE